MESVTDIITACVVIGFGVNVLNEQTFMLLAWRNILNTCIWLGLKGNKLTDVHHLLIFCTVYDSAAPICLYTLFKLLFICIQLLSFLENTQYEFRVVSSLCTFGSTKV